MTVKNAAEAKRKIENDTSNTRVPDDTFEYNSKKTRKIIINIIYWF